MFDECPNVMIIPGNEETPIELVERYTQLLEYNLKKGNSVKEVLHMFFEDVNIWSCKQYLIDSAKTNLQHLEDINNFLIDPFAEDENFDGEDLGD